MNTYVLIDVSQKQQYIYRSDKLRDNLYYSAIIKTVTESFKESFKDEDEVNKLPAFITEQDTISLDKFLSECFKVNQDTYDIKYSGGGNSIIWFSKEEDANTFIQHYSYFVLKDYPELELYISKVNKRILDENANEASTDSELKYSMIRKYLYDQIDILKDQRRAQFKRWTYGVEQIDETGKALLASKVFKEQGNEPSEEKENSKRQYELARQLINGRLPSNMSGSNNGSNVKLTSKLQDYNKNKSNMNNEDSEELNSKSYIAVIAIDGNMMGKMVEQIKDFEDLKAFSTAIEEIYAKSVALALEVEAKEKGDTSTKLYATPVVLSGDDICLITPAEHGISIAAKIVKNIELALNKNTSSALSQESKNISVLRRIMNEAGITCLTACAGVCIARVTYPFFELVKKAEALCEQAKGHIPRLVSDQPDVSLELNRDTELGSEGQVSTNVGASSASLIQWEIVQGQIMNRYHYEEDAIHGKQQAVYQITPLRIDQDKSLCRHVTNNNPTKEVEMISYRAFECIVKEIQKNQDELISKSSIEEIKKHIYQGWESYDQVFKEKVTSVDKLNEIIQKKFPESDQYQVESATLKMTNTNKRIYVLNDIFEVLPFMKMNKGIERC